MLKTKEQVLADFNAAKSNATRKRRAANAGFGSIEEFIAHLEAGIAKEKEERKKVTVHNIFILDKSSSMSGERIRGALLGINSELEELKTIEEVEYTNSVVTFGSKVGFEYWKKPIKECSKLEYYASGMTALNDAIGLTISRIRFDKKAEDKVLIKIFTDGQENNSTEFNYHQIKALIKEVEEQGFTVTFVGTEYDTQRAIQSYGLHTSNTMFHMNTEASIQSASKSRGIATANYSKKVALGEDVKDGFFKDIED